MLNSFESMVWRECSTRVVFYGENQTFRAPRPHLASGQNVLKCLVGNIIININCYCCSTTYLNGIQSGSPVTVGPIGSKRVYYRAETKRYTVHLHLSLSRDTRTILNRSENKDMEYDSNIRLTLIIYGHHHFQQSKDQPGMVAKPARGQLRREMFFPLSPFAPEKVVSRDRFGRPFPSVTVY